MEATETFAEHRLIAAKNELLNSIASALESGMELSRALEILGVEGRMQTMFRALLSRYKSADLAAMFRELENTSIGGYETDAPEPTKMGETHSLSDARAQAKRDSSRGEGEGDG